MKKNIYTYTRMGVCMYVRIYFLGKEITPVSSAKDLGIILNNNLTYDQHIYQPHRAWPNFVK